MGGPLLFVVMKERPDTPLRAAFAHLGRLQGAGDSLVHFDGRIVVKKVVLDRIVHLERIARMPVLGADPDAPLQEWPEDTVPYQPQFTPPRTRALVNYFGYHRRMQFSQRFNDFDKKILSSHFGRMTKRGYSVPELEDMVDRFFHTWGSEYEEPAPAFCSKTMQDQLTTTQTVRIAGATPELQWLADGMPSKGPFEDPKHTRKLVTLYGSSVLNRYPDVVARILEKDTSGRLSPLLKAFVNLVGWNLGETPLDRPDVTLMKLSEAGIALPPELRSERPSPKSIRPAAQTLRQAVGRIPQRKS